MRYRLLVLGCLALPISPVRGQGPVPGLTPGAPVRVTARAAGLRQSRGTVVSISTDTLVVTIQRATMVHGSSVVRDTLVRVPVGDLERLEARRRAPFNWAGAAIGGGLGGVLTVSGGVPGVLTGVSLGAIVGGGGKHALKGGAIGAAVTAVPFALIMGMTFDESAGCGFVGPCNSGEAAAWGAVGGGVLGFVVGSVAGTLSRGEWRAVSLNGGDLAVTPWVGPSDLGVAASVSF